MPGRRKGDKFKVRLLAQRDARHVRGIALTPTQGLARGMVVTDTGGPLQARRAKGEYARLYVFHNRPKSGALYQPVSQRLLPLDAQWQNGLSQDHVDFDVPDIPRAGTGCHLPELISCQHNGALSALSLGTSDKRSPRRA